MIELEVMNEIEFKKYIDFMIEDYAKGITENFNLSKELALEESKTMMKDIFQNGLETEGQYLYNIKDNLDNCNVGIIWFSINNEINQAYLYHILINEEYRGRGYGTKTIEEVQSIVKRQGITSIGLSVFGNNESAYHLYKKLGFSTTRISMEKIL